MALALRDPRVKHEDNGFNVIQVGKPLTFACVGGDFLKQ